MATKIFPEFQFQWLVDQIKANLPLELDFLNEGKNCEKMRDVLTDFSGIRVSFFKRGKSLKSLNFFFVNISIDEIGLNFFSKRFLLNYSSIFLYKILKLIVVPTIEEPPYRCYFVFYETQLLSMANPHFYGVTFVVLLLFL